MFDSQRRAGRRRDQKKTQASPEKENAFREHYHSINVEHRLSNRGYASAKDLLLKREGVRIASGTISGKLDCAMKVELQRLRARRQSVTVICEILSPKLCGKKCKSVAYTRFVFPGLHRPLAFVTFLRKAASSIDLPPWCSGSGSRSCRSERPHQYQSTLHSLD